MVSPGTGLSASGDTGGPFSPAGKSYTLTNTGGTTINYTISKKQSWLSLSRTSGSLTQGASTSVVVSINSSANNLGANTYSDTVTFTNTTNGNGNASRSVSLTVIGEAGPRVTEGLVAFYPFTEGSGTTINDVSGFGAPLNLTAQNEAAISWIAGGGLSVNSPTIISSAGAATKVIDAIKAGNEITIEAWVNPANTTQAGPARIVTLSKGKYDRNFTLAQQNTLYDVRLRTSSTDLNGRPSSNTPAGSLTADLTHVVYTRNTAGVVFMYINGTESASSTVDGTTSNWDGTYRLALANESTLNRAWLGEIHLVAIFDRALSQTEVAQNFSAGLNRELISDIPNPPTGLTVQIGFKVTQK